MRGKKWLLTVVCALLLVGVVCEAICVPIGVILGALAGYFGGWFDALLSRITDADPELTMAGALLHDIGRSVDHSIMHAYIGSQIVQAEGMPQELVDIVRKHTGAGLDEEDVAEMNLPPADYMPRTLEEKIVAHADNLVSDNRVVEHTHSVEKLRNKGADRGADRIEELHRELSRLYGEDMDVIPERIGQYPDLPLARRFDLL